MTDLVTGGAGYIGRHVVAALLSAGRPVRVLDRAAAPGLPADVGYIRGSVTDRDTVRGALDGVERVFHLAAIPHLWARDRQDFDAVNAGGTRIILEAARQAGVSRVVHCSTDAILLAGRDRIADETVAMRAAAMPGPYCLSKLRAEEAARQAAADGLPVVIVNPTVPVGPGDASETPPTRMLLDFLNGRTPAFLDCTLNLVDVRDVASGHLLAAARGRSGERYILGGETLDLAALLERLQRLSGRRMPRRRIPYWLALAAAHVDEAIADHLTGRPPRAPVTGVRLARRLGPLSTAKAARDLGFAARPLADSLRDFLNWAAETGRIFR
ncbi:MAG: NAD-dependent epimerase/dehydratase family protein [Alphaproteobacteria bacterium]|nr:NAD-dependent epimerase/dehydratase family protein [Alphaproteobacteria bacterium]